MICKHCGAMVRGSAMVCDQCGGELTPPVRESGAAGIRQGRSLSQSAPVDSSHHDPGRTELFPDAPIAERRRRRYENDAGRPASRRGLPHQSTIAVDLPSRRDKRPRVHKVMINWALVGLIGVVLFVFALMGGYIYLKTTDPGQLILARMGKEVNAEALWSLGTEYLDQGYIERAIASYESAYEQEPEREDIYDKLLLLAEAYEAGGYAGKAEEVFIKLYTELDETNVVAYRNRVRLLTDQSRLPELADFLKFAYEKTGDTSFSKQREEMLPSAPTVNKAGSTYRLTDSTYQEIELESAEGYDIYYIINGTQEDTLPEAGTLYTEPIKLYEGGHVLRAVAVSSELVSDEMSATYSVALPVPEAPKCSLAPGTYEKKQRVWLRYPDEKNAENVTIYYTIDGQSPTANSPIYTGEPVTLPGGRVHIKAVAVNQYGKVSNEMDVEVKVNIGFKRYFYENDVFNDFTILTTSYDRFTTLYGDPVEEVEITDVMPGTCLKLSYSWGEARFYLSEKGYVLYMVETSSSSMRGPRSTKVGMKAEEVTEKYRDMGQTFDQNGDRSIYWDEAEGYGKIYKLEDDSGRIDYVYYTEDGGSMILSYYLQNNTVVRMGMRYQP